MVHAPVPRIDASSPTAADELYALYRTGRSPVVVEGAIDEAVRADPRFDVEALRAAAAPGDAGEVRVMVRDTKRSPVRYRELRLPSIDAYFRHVLSSRDSGRPQTCGLQNGYQVPMAALPSSVPAVLRSLHEDGAKVPLRDLLGRKFARLFVSTRGYHGRAHYDRLGLPFFTAQVRGEKRWWLYAPDALPLDREECFDNAPALDFADPLVRGRYEGFEAHIRAGDILLVPPFFYHHVEHLGLENVNLDYACAPCPVWRAALTSSALPAEDLIGLLGSRAFLCIGCPAALLPEGEALTKARMYLTASSFPPREGALTMEYLSARRSEQEGDSGAGAGSRRWLEACRASAASNGVDSQLLEACVACEIVFADAGAVARALARLVHHLGDDGDALGSLVDTLKLVRSVASEMREQDARGAANGRAEGIPGIPTDDQEDGREPPRVAAVLAALFVDGDAAVG